MKSTNSLPLQYLGQSGYIILPTFCNSITTLVRWAQIRMVVSYWRYANYTRICKRPKYRNNCNIQYSNKRRRTTDLEAPVWVQVRGNRVSHNFLGQGIYSYLLRSTKPFIPLVSTTWYRPPLGVRVLSDCRCDNWMTTRVPCGSPHFLRTCSQHVTCEEVKALTPFLTNASEHQIHPKHNHLPMNRLQAGKMNHKQL